MWQWFVYGEQWSKKICGIGMLLVSFGVASPATANHLEFFWNRNTEADMKEYRLYSSLATPCTVGVDTTLLAVVPQPSSGLDVVTDVPHGQEGFACVTALDQAGNESGASNTVPFDAKPPVGPGGFGWRKK